MTCDVLHLTPMPQDIDSKADASNGGASASHVSLDTGGSGGLWEPIRAPPVEGGQPGGRLERSNSFDSNSSEGFGFNARDGSGL